MIIQSGIQKHRLDILLITGFEDFSRTHHVTRKIDEAYKKFLVFKGNIIDENKIFPKGTSLFVKKDKGAFIKNLLAGGNFKYPPSLNGLLLATNLEAEGYSYILMNSISYRELQSNDFIEKYTAADPISIGISSTFIHNNSLLKEIVSFIARRFPASKIIVGGPFVSQNKIAMEIPEIDIFVFGRGENKLGKILHALKNDPDSLSKIDGIAFRKNGILNSVPGKNESDFEESLPPDWSFLLDALPESQRSVLKKYYIFPLETMLGCPYNCSFCNYHQYGVQIKSADKIISEIETLAEIGIKNIAFWDSLFTISHPIAKSVCEKIIEKKLTHIRYYSYGNIRNQDPTMMQLLEKAGWQTLYIGIESGSDRILKNMRKGFTRKDVFSFFKVMAAQGPKIQPWGSFIIGHPGENDDTVKETRDLIHKLNFPFINIHSLEIRPNSYMFLEPERFNINFTHENEYQDIYEWEHATMTSREAEEKTFDLFLEIGKNCSSLMLEVFFNITDLAHKFPPYRNKKNFEALLKIQEGICLVLSEDPNLEQKRDMFWSELFQNNFDLVDL